MITGRDSSAIPSDDVLRAAYGAGVRVWGGYFDGPGIGHGWSAEDFQRIRDMHMTSVAYCSGWSDPVAMRRQQETWGVDYLFLDVESRIRDDGPWVQSWLDRASCGLYGNEPVFRARTFPYAQLAAYVVNTEPVATWWVGQETPSAPHGWQWRGTHTEFAISCDSAVWDDSFGPQQIIVPPFNEEDPMLAIRPDRGAADYFIITTAGELATGSIDAQGGQVKAYVPSPYAGKVITAILGAAWTAGSLVAQVVGNDGVTYLAVFTAGAWLPYQSA